MSSNAALERGISRRQFLVSSAAGAFFLYFSVDGATRATEAAGLPASATQIGTWVRIGQDDSVTVLIGASEMGQGVQSGLAQILAEDLMVDWAKVKAEAAPADPSFANPLFHLQLTGGSTSIRGYYQTLRQAGATAREMLIAAAAKTWGVAPSACHAQSGTVVNEATGAVLTYGQLAPLAATMPVPNAPALVGDDALRLIGKPLKRVDLAAKVDGSAIYGLDVRVPDMAYAVVKHCPWLGGTIAATPAAPAGAIAVVPLSVYAGNGRGSETTGMVNAVAVVASNTWKAMRLASQLQARWNVPASSQTIDSNAILTQARQLIASGPALNAETIGDVDPVLSDPKSFVVDSTYTLPYLAHATMEVPNCTVRIAGGACEVWAPTQGQAFIASTVNAVTGIDPSKVTLHTTFLGGGLGRKFEQDFVSQAVQVAKAIGRPVKLMWPREEDLSRDQYRPMAVVRVRAGLDASGKVAAWWYRNCSPSITMQRRPTFTDVDSQAIDGATTATGLTYRLGSRLVEHVVHPSPVPTGYWRSVGHSINTFAIESMIDELAFAASADPYEFRRAMLADDARALAVLDRVAALAGWSTPPPAGHARGIALAWAFDSVVAQVAEVSVPATGQMRIHKICCAIDCGRAINPNSVAAQMEGGIVHGINAAMWGQVTFTAGKANVRNFDTYPVMRPQQMPVVKVAVMPPNPAARIGGVGEPGVPAVAPALANAYFAATGKRVRDLPFYPGTRMGGL